MQPQQMQQSTISCIMWPQSQVLNLHLQYSYFYGQWPPLRLSFTRERIHLQSCIALYSYCMCRLLKWCPTHLKLSLASLHRYTDCCYSWILGNNLRDHSWRHLLQKMAVATIKMAANILLPCPPWPTLSCSSVSFYIFYLHVDNIIMIHLC